MFQPRTEMPHGTATGHARAVWGCVLAGCAFDRFGVGFHAARLNATIAFRQLCLQERGTVPITLRIAKTAVRILNTTAYRSDMTPIRGPGEFRCSLGAPLI